MADIDVISKEFEGPAASMRRPVEQSAFRTRDARRALASLPRLQSPRESPDLRWGSAAAARWGKARAGSVRIAECDEGVCTTWGMGRAKDAATYYGLLRQRALTSSQARDAMLSLRERRALPRFDARAM